MPANLRKDEPDGEPPIEPWHALLVEFDALLAQGKDPLIEEFWQRFRSDLPPGSNESDVLGCLLDLVLHRQYYDFKKPDTRKSWEQYLVEWPALKENQKAEEAIRTQQYDWERNHNEESPAASPVLRSEIQEWQTKFDIERELGRGGFGSVFLGRDRDTGKQVAIKVVDATKTDAKRTLGNEVNRLHGLSHPNIVALLKFGFLPDHGQDWYLVFEYIDGGDLCQRLEEAGGPLDLTLAVTIAMKIARALHHAHKHGPKIIHRDIKPGNILLDRRDEPYLSDFGLATTKLDVQRGAGFGGTRRYLSPEQFSGNPDRISYHTDIYSLGVVLYEMLTGKWPFDVANDSDSAILKAIRYQPRPSLWIANPNPPENERVQNQLDAICKTAMQFEPDARFANAKVMADELSDVLKLLQKSENPPPPPPKPYRKIFASYSRKDSALVDQHINVASLGDKVLRDRADLRSGEIWRKGLQEMIREADIFQLYWSQNSMQSKHVREEWEFALTLSSEKENFIRPVYWEESCPPPPPELEQIHFQRIQIREPVGPIPPVVAPSEPPPNRLTGRKSWTKMIGVVALSVVLILGTLWALDRPEVTKHALADEFQKKQIGIVPRTIEPGEDPKWFLRFFTSDGQLFVTELKATPDDSSNLLEVTWHGHVFSASEPDWFQHREYPIRDFNRCSPSELTPGSQLVFVNDRVVKPIADKTLSGECFSQMRIQTVRIKNSIVELNVDEADIPVGSPVFKAVPISRLARWWNTSFESGKVDSEFQFVGIVKQVSRLAPSNNTIHVQLAVPGKAPSLNPIDPKDQNDLLVGERRSIRLTFTEDIQSVMAFKNDPTDDATIDASLLDDDGVRSVVLGVTPKTQGQVVVRLPKSFVVGIDGAASVSETLRFEAKLRSDIPSLTKPPKSEHLIQDERQQIRLKYDGPIRLGKTSDQADSPAATLELPRIAEDDATSVVLWITPTSSEVVLTLPDGFVESSTTKTASISEKVTFTASRRPRRIPSAPESFSKKERQRIRVTFDVPIQPGPAFDKIKAKNATDGMVEIDAKDSKSVIFELTPKATDNVVIPLPQGFVVSARGTESASDTIEIAFLPPPAINLKWEPVPESKRKREIIVTFSERVVRPKSRIQDWFQLTGDAEFDGPGTWLDDGKQLRAVLTANKERADVSIRVKENVFASAANSKAFNLESEELKTQFDWTLPPWSKEEMKAFVDEAGRRFGKRPPDQALLSAYRRGDEHLKSVREAFEKRPGIVWEADCLQGAIALEVGILAYEYANERAPISAADFKKECREAFLKYTFALSRFEVCKPREEQVRENALVELLAARCLINQAIVLHRFPEFADKLPANANNQPGLKYAETILKQAQARLDKSSGRYANFDPHIKALGKWVDGVRKLLESNIEPEIDDLAKYPATWNILNEEYPKYWPQ
jgi:serine/threonine protein kinase